MEFKPLFIVLLGLLISLYSVLTMQFFAMIVILATIAILLYIMETIIPALAGFLNNIQRIADNLEAIRHQSGSDTPGSGINKT
jgi:hypothetical protein